MNHTSIHSDALQHSEPHSNTPVIFQNCLILYILIFMRHLRIIWIIMKKTSFIDICVCVCIFFHACACVQFLLLYVCQCVFVCVCMLVCIYTQTYSPRRFNTMVNRTTSKNFSHVQTGNFWTIWVLDITIICVQSRGIRCSLYLGAL